MDLWKEFEISERITDIWRELGISAGTAIIVLIVLYFVIKWAVKNGIKEAHEEITKKNTHINQKTDKATGV
jgi:hypothetical protein